MATYEVISTVLGMTSTWTVEARNLAEARRVAREELKRSWTAAAIDAIRPVGYKPKKEVRAHD